MDWQDTYRGKRVLVTGHTGFKGGWLALWLESLGARVSGFGLPPTCSPSLFQAARVGTCVEHVEGDIRELEHLASVWREVRPEIVFHLAAQPLVRESYRQPLATVETNVLGTAHVLEIASQFKEPTAVVVITTDKCYQNGECADGYREDDRLGGHDLYSASKAAAELLAAAWRKSFFEREAAISVATVRAGNVIGGGDWAADRILPDCVRSIVKAAPVMVRNPHAIRPWQHVLEPLSGYLALGARLLSPDADVRRQFSDAWNFGPQSSTACTVRELVTQVVTAWGDGAAWMEVASVNEPHEAATLRLNIEKAGSQLAWAPRWSLAETVRRTVDWYKAFYAGSDMQGMCLNQIREYSSAEAVA